MLFQYVVSLSLVLYNNFVTYLILVEQIETTLKPLTQIYTTPPFPGLIQTEEDIALPGVWACRMYRHKRYTQWQT
jgi:hypothetical protein